MAQTIAELQAEGKILEILDLFPRQGKWTEEDYFRLPEANRIIELSEGRLIITPSPTEQHQRISFRLSLLLGNYVLTNNLGEVRYSPLDVRLWPGNIRQPDIVFMSNEHRDRITENFWGVPDLVVEVISKSSEHTDRVEKFNEYAEAGIQEYWMVDAEERTIEVFALEQGRYVLFGKWGAGAVARSKIMEGFETEVDPVMERR